MIQVYKNKTGYMISKYGMIMVAMGIAQEFKDISSKVIVKISLYSSLLINSSRQCLCAASMTSFVIYTFNSIKRRHYYIFFIYNETNRYTSSSYERNC